MQVSTKSIAAIPSLIIYPFFPTIILGIFFILWTSVLLYLFSAGEIRQNTCTNGCCEYDLATQSLNCNGCCGYEFHHSKNVVWAILFHIFGGFWIAQFINACSLTIIAGAVVNYYWVRGDRSVSLFAPFPSQCFELQNMYVET
jgi:choline transporter-like protein 2/4/5